MKRSPIQLIQTTLLKLAVEPVQDDRFGGRKPATPFEYDKVVLETARSCRRFPEYWNGRELPIEGIADKTYLVYLGLRTPTDGEETGPYKFEVVCSGVIAVMPTRTPGKVSDDDLALQFGLTLLYGVIREQLTNLTHRMTWGDIQLPTMNFLDETLSQPQPAGPAPAIEGESANTAAPA